MAESDIDIARAAKLTPILDLARERLGIAADALAPYGHYKAKLSLAAIEALKDRPDGKLILVTSISPTPAGEGKTTTAVGLGDGLGQIGKKTMIALREPSLGPCFGIKGGAAGGGRAQVVPMEDINLHFTGDLHAIAAANNLLAAMIDNHVYWGNALGIDTRRIAWRRVMDMNERALRTLVCGLGGPANGFAREDHFDITAASEVMAVLCLADGLADLERRLGNIVAGERRDGTLVRAQELEASGAMSVLLKDAIQPNLVQTLEQTPAFVHGGPFANIAHGCNSVLATRAALKLADYVVTEAGFGADLGAEKFYDITCRKAGLAPALSVLVVTAHALKMHGGTKRENLKKEDVKAIGAGLPNLRRHLANLHRFGVPVLCAINRFADDTEAELAEIEKACAELGVEAVRCDHFMRGGKGAADLARAAVRTIDSKKAAFKPLYADSMSLWDKAGTIARDIYGAEDIAADAKVRERFSHLEEAGFASYPVCMAKTQASFSTNPALLGAPDGHIVTIRELRLAAGAEFVVAVCGDIMTMPGLPRRPAAERIHIDAGGLVEGLF